MGDASQAGSAIIEFAADGASADLVIEGEVDAARCADLLLSHGVELTDEILRDLDELVTRAEAPKGAPRRLALGEVRALNPGGAAPEREPEPTVISADFRSDEPFHHTGGLTIQGAVKPGARLTIDGPLAVQGVIEQATIATSGDLEARGGVAGRNDCRLVVGGRARAKYLDAVDAEIVGALTVEREIVNSTLVVHDGLSAAEGRITGGVCTVMGPVRLRALGSEAGVVTRLTLGSVPMIEPLIARLAVLSESLGARREEAARRLEHLKMPGRRLSPAEKEQMTELGFEIHEMNDRARRCEEMLMNCRQFVRDRRLVDLSVEREIHPGVLIQVATQAFEVTDRIEGPIRIHRSGRDVVYQRNQKGEPASLSLITRLKAGAR